ncbi:putative acetyl xylan esterase [Artomyces pyxidatus]|uniref:Acetyl xylan esterase n=1 Tax=Artomyces pyxidatus TaxID=48021 RepID=A0ACB8T6A9_9AGAM|nr:putative acetyl xylan esterase [Artomyces pyxidatus]
MSVRKATIASILGATLALAQCPQVHIFGARETTAPPGYGSSSTVVNDLLAFYPGSTSESINYPACGGQSTCGDVSYANSVIAGVQAVASQVNTFNQQCPNTVLVLVGYSQGGQIFDDAYCGGGDTNEGLSSTAIPISSAALSKIAAAIFMGDPRHIPGLTYNVGTCQASGFAPRPTGFQCPYAANIQSYCDSSDPYCCNGNNAATHQGYGAEYGAQASQFVEAKVNAMLSGTSTSNSGTTTTSSVSKTTTSTGPTTTAPPTGGTAPRWAQCGGIGYNGPTVCASPWTCTYSNAYYSQCL